MSLIFLSWDGVFLFSNYAIKVDIIINLRKSRSFKLKTRKFLYTYQLCTTPADTVINAIQMVMTSVAARLLIGSREGCVRGLTAQVCVRTSWVMMQYSSGHEYLSHLAFV